MRCEVGEIRDNGGRTMDRYTIEILYGVTDGDSEGSYFIGAGETGNVPDGFFMTVDGPSDDPEIEFEELPERVQRDVVGEIIRVLREEPDTAVCRACGGTGQRATARTADGRELERHERSGTRCDACKGTGYTSEREEQ